MKLLQLFVLFFILNPLFGQVNKASDYGSPLKIPFSFSGGFGELRKNHFHTGLDFRTSGQTGIPVYAVREGSVARISVSPYGYGHALYLIHSDGRTTVYGHLSRYSPKIEEYLLEQQYRLKQFAVDLNIPVGLIPFHKGEIIAWSGNTGGSGGPHLHFEIRDTQSEKPQNPLFFLSGIRDKSSPRITSLFLYPLTESSHVNKSRNKMRIETISANRMTKIKNQAPIEVFGDIGLGIQTDDDFDGAGFKCGIYSAELIADQKHIFSFTLDDLAFDMGRYVNSHIDYEEMMKNKRWIHRLYLQPGNQMEIYKTDSNRGILKLTDGKVHSIKIVVTDAFNNANIFTFNLLSKNIALPIRKLDFTEHFHQNEENEVTTDDVKIKIPKGALYDELNFVYRTSIKENSKYSATHHIHNQYVPVHIPYYLSIKTHNIPFKYQTKAMVVSLSQSGSPSSIGGEYKDGWLTAHPRSFGDFAVLLDTIPPSIHSVGIKADKTLTDPRKIEFKISDNLSGIEMYQGEIDGNWVLFEYDAKTDSLVYTFDKKRLVSGKMHTLLLKIGDERKNVTDYKSTFYW
ncbi:MAG: M23 family metallopeptidase [Prolixibacteraceae bacterium]